MLLAFNLKHILITYQKKIPKGLSLALTLSRSMNTWGSMGASVGKCSPLCFLAHPHSSKDGSSFSALLQHPAHTHTAGAYQGAGQCICASSFSPNRWGSRTYATAQCVLSGWKKEWTKERKKETQPRIPTQFLLHSGDGLTNSLTPEL